MRYSLIRTFQIIGVAILAQIFGTLHSQFGNHNIFGLEYAKLGYMENYLVEIDLKSIFRAFSCLENWTMINRKML